MKMLKRYIKLLKIYIHNVETLSFKRYLKKFVLKKSKYVLESCFVA
jgi:hypothetical protein